MPSLSSPPGPTSRLPGGLLFELRRDPLAFFLRVRSDHGPIAHWRIGPQRVFLISEPAVVEELLVKQYRHFVKSGALTRSKFVLGEGLLTSEGEAHLRQRRLMQPAFHRKRIAGYASVMTAHAVALSERWQDGETIDINQAMMRLTLAIVGSTLFGADVEADAREVEDCVDALLAIFDTVLLPFSGLVQRLPTAANRRAWDALARLDAIVYRLIAERRASGTDAGDLLSMLLLARDDDGSGGMSDRQVRDEAMTLFLAGHETTANALSWTFHLLATHPEVREALEAELATVLGGRAPTFEDLPRLALTERVFAESLRLYPPGWAIARKAIAEVNACELTIPKGAIVIMSPYVVHRDARYFPDPDRFDPDRWTPEAKSSRPKFSYFPFSGGARSCIGEPFAWMEAQLILATLCQAWRMAPVPGHRVEKEPLVTLRPKGGIPLVLTRRA
ncbi:MAG: cytochrome P450 [Candidatus Sericytochromatia bacterium]